MIYVVYNVSGIELGVYSGAVPEEAIEACCRDAGYESIADMESRIGRCELSAVPFSDLGPDV